MKKLATILTILVAFIAAPVAVAGPTFHNADQNQNQAIELNELLRLIQLFNSGSYHYCPDEGTEDGFCPGIELGPDQVEVPNIMGLQIGQAITILVNAGLVANEMGVCSDSASPFQVFHQDHQAGTVVNIDTVITFNFATGPCASEGEGEGEGESQYHVINLGANPEGSGSVTLDPPQPSTGYLAGTVVTLTATPEAGWEFNSWSANEGIYPEFSPFSNPTHIRMNQDVHSNLVRR
jgi:hypothetical protein